LTFCQFFFKRETRKLMPLDEQVSCKAKNVSRRDWHTKHDISEDLILRHLHVADSNTEAQNLLELELDGAANLGELVTEVFTMGDGSRELSGCV
jgi:hypothetical protein